MHKAVKRAPLRALLLAVLVVGHPQFAPAAEKAGFSAALESITATELQQHVRVLADDGLEGREAGTRGGRAAAVYVERVLTEIGVPGGAANGGYSQPFSASYCNLLARLDGSDPSLAAEWIVLGAHYDHVGYGTRRNSFGPVGVVHNGADDNASGTSAILELIEAFACLGQAPRRSILFALWDGEEKGMLGSKHWVAQPTVPLGQVRITINLDMVGRLRDARLQVIGTRTGWGLRRRLSEATQGTGLWLDLTWKLRANADHWSFIEHGIPSLLMHTGLHNQYHRSGDDAHLINAQGMHDIVCFLFQFANQLADADQLPRYRLAGRYETPAEQSRRQQPLVALAPRLGVAWSTDDRSERGVRLTHVAPRSAAEAGGLRAGDCVLAVDERPLASGDELRAAVLRAENSLQLVVERPGADGAQAEPIEMTVQLNGPPVRIGISWREDDAERGSVLLTRVVPGSPAHQAGLNVLDRIYEIGGTRFADTAAFAQRLADLSGPVQLLVERRGQLRTTTLELPLAETEWKTGGVEPAPH